MGISLAQVAEKINKSSGYITSMASNDSKMLYIDLKGIARALDIHGANQLVIEPGEEQIGVSDGKGMTEDTDKDIMEEMKANMTFKERRTEALEAIAGCLVELNDLLREMKGAKND
jgi:hypothetical protein